MLAQLLPACCIHLFSASLIKQQFLLGIDCSPVFRPGRGKPTQYPSVPSALCCSHDISLSVGICYVLTLLLLLQWEEHLHQTPSPSLLLSPSCTSQAAHSAEPSQAASSHAQPSCATSAGLELEGIWPHPPVAMSPFPDLNCLDVYPSVCKDQAIQLVLSWGVLTVLLQRCLPRLERPGYGRSGGTRVGLLMVALN